MPGLRAWEHRGGSRVCSSITVHVCGISALLRADADAALTRSQRVCDPTPTQRFTGRFHLVWGGFCCFFTQAAVCFNAKCYLFSPVLDLATRMVWEHLFHNFQCTLRLDRISTQLYGLQIQFKIYKFGGLHFRSCCFQLDAFALEEAWLEGRTNTDI